MYPFHKGNFWKGGIQMTVGDAILNLVDKLLAEREKVVRLELLHEQQLSKEKQSGKDQL